MIDTEISMAAEQIGNVRIVCVGDVMLDRFVYGDVPVSNGEFEKLQ